MPCENETVETSGSAGEAARPYRRNAAAVVVNADGHVLVGWKHKTWQLPQGGVDDDETYAEALVRELSEEIGTERFSVVGESAREFCYDWPRWLSTRSATAVNGRNTTSYGSKALTTILTRTRTASSRLCAG